MEIIVTSESIFGNLVLFMQKKSISFLACFLLAMSASLHAASAEKSLDAGAAGLAAQASGLQEIKPDVVPGAILGGIVLLGLAGYRESKRLQQLRQRVTSKA